MHQPAARIQRKARFVIRPGVMKERQAKSVSSCVVAGRSSKLQRPELQVQVQIPSPQNVEAGAVQ